MDARTVFKTLYSPISIPADKADPKYFTPNEDGTFTATNTLIIKIARRLKKLAEDKIRAGKDGTYMKPVMKTPTKEVDDPWDFAMKKAGYEAKYAKELAAYEEQWKAYKTSHANEFETQEVEATGNKDENSFFAGFAFDLNGMSTAELVSLYNLCSELDGSVIDRPKMTKVVSKKEFGPVRMGGDGSHAKVREEIMAKVGLPKFEDVTTIDSITIENYSFQKKKVTEAGQITDVSDKAQEFVTGILGWIADTKPEDFLKQKAETMTLLNEDFVMSFNDSSKELKADSDTIKIGSKNTVKAIKIWTKATENESAVKIIEIFKDDPSDDNYKYRFSVKTDDSDLSFNRTIATKADLRKAMSTTIMMIEDVEEFKKYIPDIERAMEAL